MPYITTIEQLAFVLSSIVEDAKEHNFYTKEVALWVICVGQTFFDKKLPMKHLIRYDQNGWAIFLERESIELKFVFVQPHARRKGWFTNLLKNTPRHKPILVCTKEDAMVRTLIATGFTLHGKSTDNKELRFELHPAQKSCDV
tara:strand:+ start:510 stop:938 length:429 start_codon:yes stop_codon:yes gene_type:complete